MTASDYPVTFGYRATDGQYYGPNGSVGKYHRGNDHACPTGTPIVISGVTIGETGNTGVSGGPHLHVQAGTDIGCQKDIDPTPYEFKPGTVVAVGTGSQWGKFITMQVGDKYVTYCHLSKQSVTNGQQIGGDDMIENSDSSYALASATFERIRGGQLARADFNGWVGRPWSTFIQEMFDDKQAAATLADLQRGVVAGRDNWQQQIIDRDAWIAYRDKQIKALKDQLAQSDGGAAEKLQAIKEIVG